MVRRGFNDIARASIDPCSLETPEGIGQALNNVYQYVNTSFIANSDSDPGAYISITPVDGSGAPPRIPKKHSVAWAYTTITGYGFNKTLTTDAMGVPKWVTSGDGGGTATVVSDNGSGIEIVESPTDTFNVSTNFTTAAGCGIKKTASGSDTSIAIEADLESGDGIQISSGSGTAKSIKALISSGTGITVTQGATIEIATNLTEGNGINITGSGEQTIAADIQGGDGITVTQGATILIEANLDGGNGITITPGDPTTIEANVEGGYGIAVSDGPTIEIEADIEAGNGISLVGTNPVSISAVFTEGNGIEITPGTLTTIAAKLTNGDGIKVTDGPTIEIEHDLLEGTGITFELVGTSLKIHATPAIEAGPGITVTYPGGPEDPPVIETNYEYPGDGAIVETPGSGTTINIDIDINVLLDRLNTGGYTNGVLVRNGGTWTIVEMSPECDAPDPEDNPENNWGGSGAPGASNDITEGYYPGSNWFDTMTNDLYLCVNNSSGSAVWVKIN